MLADEVMASALIDRLVHHCHIVNIRGNSYRMRHHADVSAALHAAPPDLPAPAPHARRRSRPEAPTP